VNGLLLSLAIATAVGGLLFSNPTLAQHPPQFLSDFPVVNPPAPKPSTVQILQEPGPERIAPNGSVVIRAVVTSLRGTDRHVGRVTYGIEPAILNQTAESPITVNTNSPTTTVRVLLPPLPKGTYYFRMTSRDAFGEPDAWESAVRSLVVP
jgi:hypothetical protein